jgi:serine/threonine-protein kinase
VPDVIGDITKDAKQALMEAGFTVRTQKEFSESVPSGSVIRTIPGAGEKADQGSEVTIVVSKGTQPVTVPDVTGQSRDAATSTLQTAGFKVNAVEQESSATSPGNVLSENPASGTSVGKGSTVTITVAKAPPQVEVPDVTGQRRGDATAQLRGSGFKVAVDEQPVGDPSQDGTVISQDPNSGTADQGSTVTITIGRATNSNPTTP